MSIQTVLRAAWPLFFGLAMMMTASGLQGVLLGVRATQAGFAAVTIGLIMSCYYIGFMGGTRAIPRLLQNVGHIRVFAALAALASITVLLHALFVMPGVWAAARIVTGFAYAGLYIVVESWLNNMATKDSRGKILGLYLLVTYLGIVCGQLLLSIAPPAEATLFILSSIFISLALVPIALSRRPGPELGTPQRMSLKALWRVSPLGVYVVAASGLTNAIILSIGAVYAARRGFSTHDISIFMSSMVAGGVFFQLPVGYLSDRMERRRAMLIVSIAGAIAALGCFALSGHIGAPFLFATFLLGGAAMTIYGVCIAYMNDHLDPSQYVSASSGMLLANGIGAVVGPTLATSLMSGLGTWTFFPVIACIFLSVTLFALYRMTRRAAPAPTVAAMLQPAPPDLHTPSQLAAQDI